MCILPCTMPSRQSLMKMPSPSPSPRWMCTSSTSKKTVVTIHGKGGNISNYKDSLIAAFPSISDVIYCRTDGASATAYIEDEILGLKMRFSSEAFRQVNSEAFSKLLSIVHEMADNFPFKCAADLYCGSGIIGLSLAKIFPEAKFWGIEINSYAVADAKYNAQTNELKNIEFFCGDAAAFRTKIGKIYSPELVIVDPPRAGLSTKMREGLFALSPKKIIYVSCNPQTLARDIAALGNTYTVKRAVPVNMFPMTKHCEAVVLLSRKDG